MLDTSQNEILFFFFQAEDGIRDADVTGVQTCALPIYDVVDVRLRGAHAEERLVGDDRRPDVEGRPQRGRDPVPFEADELDEGPEGLLGVERRDAQPPGGMVEPLEVLLRPEEPDPAVPPPEGLEPLENTPR